MAIVGATLLNTAIKVALHRPRPGNPLYEGWSAFSFPSGHSTVNVVLYGFLALLIVQGITHRARLPVILGAAGLLMVACQCDAPTCPERSRNRYRSSGRVTSDSYARH